jgi:hypothetical protein
MEMSSSSPQDQMSLRIYVIFITIKSNTACTGSDVLFINV